MRLFAGLRVYVCCALACVSVVTSGCGGSGTVPNVPATSGALSTSVTGLREDWSQIAPGVPWADSSVNGAWLSRYNGFGTTSVVTALLGSPTLELAPQAATHPSETHAGLATSTRSFGDLDASVQMQTVQQLRTPAPNPWEVAWLLWHYQDDTHFYYLILKPNGWELGKEDPAYPDAQRFLSSGTEPKFATGTWNTVRVIQRGGAIAVSVNGSLLTTFSDLERPYSSGSLGLYCEDSRVQFGPIAVN